MLAIAEWPSDASLSEVPFWTLSPLSVCSSATARKWRRGRKRGDEYTSDEQGADEGTRDTLKVYATGLCSVISVQTRQRRRFPVRRKPWEGKEKWSPLGYRKSVQTNHRPVQTAQALPFPLTYHLGRLYQSHSSLGVVQHQLMTGIFVQSEAICRPIPFVWLIQRPGGNSRDQFFSLFKLFFFAKWETNRVVTSL